MKNLPAHAILNSLPVGLTFADSEGIILYYNEFIKRFFKRSPDIVGKPLWECHNEESRKQIDRMYAEFRAGRTEPFLFPGQSNEQQYLTVYQPIFENGEFVGCLETLLQWEYWISQVSGNTGL